MYVNWGARLIYLGSPRTASVATSRALIEQCGFERYKGHHDGLEKARALFSAQTKNTWTVITTVRNHWDTVASWMFWGRSIPPWTIRDLEKGLAMAEEWITYDRLFLHYPDVNVVWRYENLNTHMKRTLEKYELPMPAIPHANISGLRTTRTWHDYYTPETRDYIGERFANEIALLGYTFDGITSTWIDVP